MKTLTLSDEEYELVTGLLYDRQQYLIGDDDHGSKVVADKIKDEIDSIDGILNNWAMSDALDQETWNQAMDWARWVHANAGDMANRNQAG